MAVGAQLVTFLSYGSSFLPLLVVSLWVLVGFALIPICAWSLSFWYIRSAPMLWLI